MLKHPHHNLFEKIDRAIEKGGVTLDELRKEAKRNPQGAAAKYLKSREA